MAQKKLLRVLIVVPNFYQAIGIMGLNIVKACPSIDFYLFKSHGLLRRKKDFLKLTQHVDIVHWLSNVSRLPLEINDLLGKIPCPTVGTVHHVFQGEEEKIQAASLCDVIHVESAEWLEEVTKMTGKPVILAHQPVDLSCYLNLNKEPKSIKPYRVGTFGFADSLTGRKRIDILLESLEILKSRNVPIELVVQGPHWDRMLPAFTHEGISVKNLGCASPRNAWKAYGEIDIYVCSSEIEGGPLTVIEALASRIPIVSTRVGVVPELLSNGGGIMVDKNNPEKMADAIESLVTSKDIYAQHRNSTSEAIRLFSQENISQEYQDLYKSAIQSWEDTNKVAWKKVSTSKLNPIIQRRLEILHGSLAGTRFFQAHPGKPKQIIDKVVSKLLYSL